MKKKEKKQGSATGIAQSDKDRKFLEKACRSRGWKKVILFTEFEEGGRRRVAFHYHKVSHVDLFGISESLKREAERMYARQRITP